MGWYPYTHIYFVSIYRAEVIVHEKTSGDYTKNFIYTYHYIHKTKTLSYIITLLVIKIYISLYHYTIIYFIHIYHYITNNSIYREEVMFERCTTKSICGIMYITNKIYIYIITQIQTKYHIIHYIIYFIHI